MSVFVQTQTDSGRKDHRFDCIIQTCAAWDNLHGFMVNLLF